MKRLFLLAVIISGFHLGLCSQPVKALQSEQNLVTITVSDDYTDNPVEGIQVRLLKDGSELATGTTDANGTTELQAVFTSTEETRMDLPETFHVSDSYPNPFESRSSVELSVDERQEVTAEVFNIIGQRVASLQVVLNPGSYTLQSSLGHLAQGVYFLRIFGQQVQTVKMTKVGQRIFSGGTMLEISPALLQTRNGPGMAALALDGHEHTELTLVASGDAYDTVQQSIEVSSDTTIALQMSRNNKVVFRVADETSPESDIQIPINVASGNFSTEISTPDTLTLKSGIYSVTAEEGDTDAIDEEIEIASEDQTVTVLTRLKTLGENQLRLEGLVTDESNGSPINRAYIYLLNEMTSDTLAGPLFADSDGVVEEIVNLENGSNLDLSVLYRKAGYTHFESTSSITLPDTLSVDATLQTAPAPTADFTVSGDLIAGSPVIFDASASSGASGEDLTYSWDFGNGKSGGGETIGYVYSGSGSFDVTLTVVGEFGASDEVTESVSIQPADQPAGSATLNGTIIASSGEELEGVLVSNSDGSVTGVSNPEGDVILDGLDTGIPLILTFTREGYATQYVRIEIPEGTQNSVFEATMLPRADAMIADQIEAGGQFAGNDGVNVSLPVDGFVDQDGEVVTGPVNITMTPLDVRNDNNLLAFPGSFSAVSPDGSRGELLTFGLAEYNFEQEGSPLQLAPGKKATVEIPYYLDTNAEGNPVQPGDPIPLWSLDETTGLWVEEGSGTIVASSGSPTGFTMRAEVTHFSWWNADRFNSPYTAIAECKIIDNNGLPTLDIPDGGACYIRGVSGSGCPGRGVATTQIPSGTSVEISLPGECNTTLFASSPGGNTGNSTVSGSTGSTVNVTIPLDPVDTANQTLTVNDVVTDEVNQDGNTISYLLDPEEEEFIILELEKLGSGLPISTLSLFDPNDNLIDVIELRNNDSFGSFKKRLLLDVENTGLHRIEIEHTSGNELLYTLRIQPLEELTLNTPLDFSVIRGISRYLYYVPDANYVVRSNDGGTLFQPDFTEFGNFLATEDSGGPLNLYSLREDSVYVIEHLNQDGPEVIQKEFTLTGVLRENLVLNTENVLTVDLLQSGESFPFDPQESDYIVVEIDKSPGEDVAATLSLTDPNGNTVGSDVLEMGSFQSFYRARLFDEVATGGNYTITVTPVNGSTGNYSIRTYAPEELELGVPSDYSVAAGGSYYHIYRPDRDEVVRGTPSGELLDDNLDPLASMAEFSSPGKRPEIGRLLSANTPYLLFQNNQFGTSPNVESFSASFILSEVRRTEMVLDGGEFITSAEFSNLTDAHVFTFEAEPNSAVVATISNDRDQPISDFYIGRIGNGTYYDVNQIMNSLSSYTSFSTRSILESSTLDQYVVIIKPDSEIELGSYQLQVDIAEENQNYIISSDLSCAGSTLRNIQAAAIASPVNSTITVCEGVYEESTGIEFLNSGVTLTGTDHDGTILRSGTSSQFVRTAQSDITLENLTIEASGGSSNSGTVRIEGDRFTFRNITMKNAGDGIVYESGLYIGGSGAIIEQSEFINGGSGTAIFLGGPNGVTIDSNIFSNHGFAIRSRSLQGDVSITNNEFIYNEGSATPAAAELAFSRFAGNIPATRIFESNIINFENESSQILTANQTPDQAIDDVIRDNTISWIPRSANSVAINAQVGRENSSSVIEQNIISTIGTSGGIGIRVGPSNSLFDTGSIFIGNNVIRDTFKGMEVIFPDWFTSPVKIFNNSIRTSAPTFTDAMVGLKVTGSSNSDNGPVKVQYVNNIFQGRSGQNDVGVDVYSGFQLDSDYNLFHNVSSIYVGGTTNTGTNDITGDPLFLNSLLELGASSPALDSGATSADYNGIPDVDINGTTRPQGSGIDRGAHEND